MVINENAFLTVIKSLEGNIRRIKYGEASVSFKVHDGRVVSVTHSLTENTRKVVSDKDIQREPPNGTTQSA